MKSFDPKADRKIYGPGYVGKYNTVICRATHITKSLGRPFIPGRAKTGGRVKARATVSPNLS
jgi:hypothetical protein